MSSHTAVASRSFLDGSQAYVEGHDGVFHVALVVEYNGNECFRITCAGASSMGSVIEALNPDVWCLADCLSNFCVSLVHHEDEIPVVW